MLFKPDVSYPKLALFGCTGLPNRSSSPLPWPWPSWKICEEIWGEGWVHHPFLIPPSSPAGLTGA